MSKTCNNCGNIFEDDSSICPRCGTQYIAIQPPKTEQSAENNVYRLPQPQYQQPYGQSQYQQQYQQPYAQPYQPSPAAEKPMSVGSWLGTILLTQLFGLISLILLFIWAFSSDTPTPKKNYCRAMLIFEAIMLVLVIGIIVLYAVILTSTGLWDEFLEEFSQYGYNF